MAVAAAVSTGLMYRQGIGLWTDTIEYFSFAESLALEDLPVHHGVLYAIFIAAFSMVGFSIPVAAAVVNLVSALLASLAVYGILRLSITTRSLWPVLIGSYLTIFSLPWLDAFAFAMSEPLFYATLLPATYFLLRSLDSANPPRDVWLSIVFISLTTLTRYAGVCFVAVFCFCLWRKHAFRWQGLRAAVVYGITAMAPLLLLLVWNRLTHGTTTNRQLLVTAIPMHYLAEGSMNIASWFVPFQLLLRWQWIHVALSVGFLLTMGLITIQAHFKGHLMVFALAVATIGYAVFYVLVSATVDLGAFNQRKLSPLFIFGVLGIISWYDTAGHGKRTFIHGIALLGSLYMILFTGYRAAGFIGDSYHSGRGFAATEWQQGSLLETVEQLHRDTIIFSNADDAFQLRTGSPIGGIPWRFIRTTTLPHEMFDREFDRMRVAFLDEGAILWHSRLRYWPPYLFPLEQIVSEFDLVPILQESTGTLFTHPSNRDAYLKRLEELR